MRIAADSAVSPRLVLPLTKQILRRTPDIWAVYLSGPGVTASADVSWLHSQGIALTAVYSGVWGSSGIAGGYAVGFDNAKEAIFRAQSLGLPGGMRLWLDVEPNWCANADHLSGAGTAARYLAGWADGFNGAEYITGVYCDPDDGSFVQTLGSARASNANVAALPLWVCEPQVSDFAGHIPAWSPGSVPPAPTVMWQAQINVPVGNGYQVDLSLVADGCAGFWEVNTTPFKDVPSNAWYAQYVEIAVAAGLMNGLTPTEFGPDQPVTRAQLAAVLARLAEILKLPLTQSSGGTAP